MEVVDLLRGEKRQLHSREKEYLERILAPLCMEERDLMDDHYHETGGGSDYSTERRGSNRGKSSED